MQPRLPFKCLSFHYPTPSIIQTHIHSLFIPQSVLGQVLSLFQTEYFTECDLVLPISNILSFLKGHIFFLPKAQQPLGGLGLLIFEASRLHLDTPHSVGLLWTSDQPDAETST
jgi:hypothetical protein